VKLRIVTIIKSLCDFIWIPQKTHISYEELEDKLEPKKKNFGKLRGAVTRK
jgi:hypothetical protein